MNKKQVVFTLVVAPVAGFFVFMLLIASYDSGVFQGTLLGFAWLVAVVAVFWWFFVRTYKKLGD